jgi:hypothetical protein
MLPATWKFVQPTVSREKPSRGIDTKKCNNKINKTKFLTVYSPLLTSFLLVDNLVTNMVILEQITISKHSQVVKLDWLPVKAI